MSGRNQYMRDYYSTHRESILNQRRLRYKNDPEFRAKQNEMRRKSRRRKNLFNNEEDFSTSSPKGTRMRLSYKGESIIVEMYTVTQFCRYNGLQRPRISKWYDAGWFTRPSYTNNQGYYLYTKYEFDGLSKIVRSHRSSQAAKGYKFKADASFKEAIHKFYAGYEKGLPNNLSEGDGLSND